MAYRTLPLSARALAALGTLAVLMVPAPPALACSIAPCEGTELLPRQGGTVPANAVTPVWLKPLPYGGGGSGTVGSAPTLADGKLYKLTDAGAQPLAFETVPVEPATVRIPLFEDAGFVLKQTTAIVRLEEPVEVGARLAFDIDEWCFPKEVVRREFLVGDAAPVPTTLGKLDVAPALGLVSISSTSGSCTEMVQASYADLTVRLAPDAEPYEALLRYELLVDGKPSRSYRPGPAGAFNYVQSLLGSALGPGKDRLLSVCGESRDPERPKLDRWNPGTYRVQMRAWLPDGSSIATDEVTVTLDCGDAGVAVGVAVAMTAPDAGAPDAGTPDARAAAPTPASNEAGSAGPNESEAVRDGPSNGAGSDDDGCALGVGPARTNGSTVLQLTLFALLLAARRRPRMSSAGLTG